MSRVLLDIIGKTSISRPLLISRASSNSRTQSALFSLMASNIVFRIWKWKAGLRSRRFFFHRSSIYHQRSRDKYERRWLDCDVFILTCCHRNSFSDERSEDIVLSRLHNEFVCSQDRLYKTTIWISKKLIVFYGRYILLITQVQLEGSQGVSQTIPGIYFHTSLPNRH